MKRSEKVGVVEELAGRFRSHPHAVLVSFTGLRANQANDLRRKLSRAGGSYRVIQNRLARRAASGTPVEVLSERFAGPCGLATHETDPVALAKTLVDFVKDNPQLDVIAGLVDGRDVIDAAGVKQLSALPGLQELRAQLLALIQTPATMIVRLVGTPATQMARVIDARREKLEGGSD